MKRNLICIGLCTIATVCLLGASAPLDAEQTPAEEPSLAGTLQETPEEDLTYDDALPSVDGEAQPTDAPEAPEEPEAEQTRLLFVPREQEPTVQVAEAVAGTDPMPLAEEAEKALKAAREVKREDRMTIDGEKAPADVGLEIRSGTPYVALAGMARALDDTATSSWNKSSSTLTIKTSKMTVTAKVGQLYVEANGRYLYLPAGVKLSNGSVSIPLATAAKIFDAKLNWNSSASTATLTTGSGALKSGSAYYDENSLFWLSRVIYLESGNQPLEGKMAVGNVVLNRVSSSSFPNTIVGVLSQKNQFSTYRSGKMKSANPNAESVIAAKLVLDGGVVAKTKGALWFDSAPSSWASRNRTYVATIGGHRFFK